MELQRTISLEQELNPQQREVVTSGLGPVLVIAGAGSGKTRTLTYRVAHLIQSGIDPHRILLLTFTNKAAKEMITRVEALLPHNVQKIWGGTFHHIANKILRVHGERIGLEQNFTILDQSDAYTVLDSCMHELGHKKKDGVLPQGSVLFNILSLARNTRTGVEEMVAQRYPFFLDYTEDIKKIELHYTAKKRARNLADFDDLLCLWLALLEESPGLKDFYAQRFEYILVDEYQDTNTLQADIIDRMASHHRNLMVVGDDSQSIYAFRGANYSNIMEFPERYKDAKIYKLEYNYRSTPEILTLANESIVFNEKQFPKVLRPIKQAGAEPHLIRHRDVYQQAQFVADTINEYVYSGVPAGEIAVLYRAHCHSMELQMELSRRRVHFEVRSGIRFFEQAHIKDIVAYLKVLINPADEPAWRIILQLLPGIGGKTSQKLFNRFAASKDPLHACLDSQLVSLVPKAAKPYWPALRELLTALIETGAEVSPATLIKTALEHGYREYLRFTYTDSSSRLDDVGQFLDFARQYSSVPDFLSELALMTSSENEEFQEAAGNEKIKLTTVHQAKGLEWSVVFIIWLVEGRFPNANNFESLEDEAEERRLFYVAVTRSKDHLYLCAPECSHDTNGYVTALKPSRFLRELPEGCYKKLEAPDEFSYSLSRAEEDFS
ncbi:MAG: ATP-dependent helicase [Pseudomonadota bacterium]